jgi:hypothetical protein
MTWEFVMKMSDRVRRGFWRIGLVGAVLAVIVAVGAVLTAGYTWLLRPKVTVWFEQSFISVPVDPTDADLALALKSRDERKTFTDLLFEPDRGKQGQPAMNVLRDAAAREHRSDIVNSLWIAAGSSAVGFMWLGFWWVFGWIVRGFLD